MRRLWLILLLLLWPLAALGAEPTARECYEQGRHAFMAFTSDGYTEAIRWYERALAKDPAFALGYAGLAEARAHLAMQNLLAGGGLDGLNKAYELGQQAVGLGPQLAETHRAAGFTELLTGRPEYEAELYKALAINPRDAETMTYLWDGLAREGGLPDPDHKLILQAIAMAPDLAYPRIERATVLMQRKRYDDALAEYRQLIRIRPDAWQYHNDMAAPLAALKRYDEALAAYRQALKGQPGSAVIRTNIALMLEVQRRFDEAIAEARLAIKSDPGHAMAYNILGESLSQLQRTEEAVEAFRESLRTDPGFIIGRTNLAGALTALKRYDEALSEYRDVLQVHPNFRFARYGLASLLAQLMRFNEAIPEFEAALEGEEVPRASALNGLGWSLAQVGRYDEALVPLKESLTLDPDNGPARHSLGFVYARQGRWREALAEFETAARLTPDNEEIRKDLLSARAKVKALAPR